MLKGPMRESMQQAYLLRKQANPMHSTMRSAMQAEMHLPGN